MAPAVIVTGLQQRIYGQQKEVYDVDEAAEMVNSLDLVVYRVESRSRADKAPDTSRAGEPQSVA